MRALFSTSSIVLATAFTLACSKQKPETTTAATAGTGTATATRATAPKARATERATGSLAEAMLHLRRVHFALDGAALLPASRTSLQEAADRLKAYPAVHIYIDGHTDERGTTEYNLGLGDRRARTVADYLAQLGIAAERLHLVTFGEEQLLEPGATQVAHAKNRRAEFRLMRGDVRLVLDEGAVYDDRGRPLQGSR